MLTAIYVAGFVLAVLGSALFAGAETAVVALKVSRVVKLRRQGKVPASQATALARVLAHKELFLGSTLIGAIVCNVAAALFLMAALELWTEPWLAAVATVVIVSVDLMLFGQIVPKLYFRQHPLELSLMLAPLMDAVLALFSPLSKSFGRLSSVLVRLAGRASPPKFSFVTREELKLLAPKAAPASGAAVDATRMIHGVFDLRQKLTRDLMVPLDKAAVVNATASVEDVLALARTTGFSRLPVVEKQPPPQAAAVTAEPKSEAPLFKQALAFASAHDAVLGIVNVYDILYAADATPAPGKTARDFLRRCPVLADADPIDRALQRLRAARLPMAIVTNAQQQAVGIITVENIVAQIVGKTA
jgi:CBS domain containing-hemolysin-like protein